jgi:hypothetical protein
MIRVADPAYDQLNFEVSTCLSATGESPVNKPYRGIMVVVPFIEDYQRRSRADNSLALSGLRSDAVIPTGAVAASAPRS